MATAGFLHGQAGKSSFLVFITSSPVLFTYFWFSHLHFAPHSFISLIIL